MDTNAKGPRVAGWKARPYVQAKQPFRNHNNQLFARWETPLLYVVYSYGDHWPLFAWDGFEWYENEDKVSPTTSKHRSQTHPLPTRETVKLSCSALKARIAMLRSSNAQMERLQNDLLAA